MAQAAEAFSGLHLTRGLSVPRFKVAMVAACPMPARRGTPLRIERLSEALLARGHQVEVITYNVADDDHPLNFPVHRIWGKRRNWHMPAGPNARKLLLYDPLLALKLWQVLARGNFDVIHAHHIEGLLASIPSKLRYGMPIVYDAHTLLGAELPSYGPRPLRWATGVAGDWLDGWLPRSADHVASVTPDIRDSLIARYGMAPERISVVMNGVEAGNFRVKEVACEDSGIRVIYSGTLAPYQDIDLLLEAFARAWRVRKDLKLCFSVSSPFEPYEEQAHRLGIRAAIEVVADGFDELPGRLAAASLAVLPRMHCPGIPQKLLNYMAAGKAVVCSAGSAKVLEHGRNGLVVANGDVEAFARAILQLADDSPLRRELGNNARRHVEQNYTWDQAADRLGSIYERLVPEPRRA
jgi:glycosyltransferase involved in cell wall biosynthesis